MKREQQDLGTLVLWGCDIHPILYPQFQHSTNTAHLQKHLQEHVRFFAMHYYQQEGLNNIQFQEEQFLAFLKLLSSKNLPILLIGLLLCK